ACPRASGAVHALNPRAGVLHERGAAVAGVNERLCAAVVLVHCAEVLRLALGCERAFALAPGILVSDRPRLAGVPVLLVNDRCHLSVPLAVRSCPDFGLTSWYGYKYTRRWQHWNYIIMTLV